jgi:acid phosphatase family membrane protein YuiD
MGFSSSPILHALLCGFLVQISKVLTFLLQERKINVRRFVETGGMPSSHAASVMALSTCVGLREGFGSVLFGVVLYFSLIVMYDAARRPCSIESCTSICSCPDRPRSDCASFSDIRRSKSWWAP